MSETTWEDQLRALDVGATPVLTNAFLEAHGHRAWAPSETDVRAASLLHLELTSRVATQEIGYSSGDEVSALESVHALFERTRVICRENATGRIFETVTWFVLNHHVRPFTSRWHRRNRAGRLAALDDTDDFRLQLAALQETLRTLDLMLLRLAGEKDPGRLPQAEAAAVDLEMGVALCWGLDKGDPNDLDGVKGISFDEIASVEREAVNRRRLRYGIELTAERATGLALSGGGIRSATFALGVLTVFAKRGLLKQFDYLSTVSGGGYLGAFLTNYLAAGETTDVDRTSGPAGDVGAGDGAIEAARPIGLERGDRPFGETHRDAAATGHIRQNSRYLASGPLSKIWSTVFAQTSGLLNNLLALSAVLCLFSALFVILIPSFFTNWIAVVSLGALSLAMIGAPLAWRQGREGVKFADQATAMCAVVLAVALAAIGMRESAAWMALAMGDDPLQLLYVCIAPLGLLVVGIVLERTLTRAPIVGRWLARSSAPLFVTIVTLASTAFFIDHEQYGLWFAVAALGIAGYYHFFLNLNVTGLHRHYRRKLAEAFLVADAKPGAVVTDDDRKLSSLAEGRLGPYPIFNAALNVPSSDAPAMRGRLTDFFSFTPHHCGSPISGYHRTTEWECLEPDLTIATAMAISGAAISPRMGLHNRGQFSFWLSLLNVRLGYWLRNPAVEKSSPQGLPGLSYLLRELTGRMDERAAFLNLSDGGHIENLGVYELLRRRCKFVVVIDGEQDQDMTFHAIANLQRLASIDLGVRIEINLDELRRNGDGLSRSHFQFCRIRYRDGAVGYMLYLKLSLTGNEGEFLRRFRLDEPAFPHHPTADQNFSEARFEAYRSLGQHVGEKLFLQSIVGAFPTDQDVDIGHWFAAMGKSLLEPLDAATSVTGDGIVAPKAIGEPA
ncbi:patatin-like phospholipase family protein [uncultured Sphingomonas sp.]|uniref:patatin-like phospholipase family protein n=1 Tax=uncultured Sphingomonas sp. TaxID=158754 RepID=UPI0025ED13E8|nr:patatin-like phospholipase family protein [uncultured Sphingomonas sp.]